MSRTQGNRANNTGKVLEQAVVSTFSVKGFNVVNYRVWEKSKDKLDYGDELLLQNVPFTSIYGHSGNTEFLLKSKKHDVEMRIECKWQASAGSVDEKFPYLYLNCIEAMPEKDILIIVDGDGYKKGALAWLKKSAETRKYQDKDEKNIRIFNLVEFIAWANKNF